MLDIQDKIVYSHLFITEQLEEQYIRQERLWYTCWQLTNRTFGESDPIYFVDDYAKVAYCDVPKAATSSWNTLYYKIVDHDLDSRQSWWAATMQGLLPKKIPTQTRWS